MNSNIATQKSLKKTLGVTITKNMSIADVTEAWGRVPNSIKSALPPEIALAFSASSLVVTGQEIARSLTTVTTEAYETCSAAIEAGVAVLGGQPQQPIVSAASEAAKLAETELNTQVTNLGPTLITQLESLVG